MTISKRVSGIRFLGLAATVIAVIFTVCISLNAQVKPKSVVVKNETSFFAVLDDGTRIEPIGLAANGKFPETEESPDIAIPQIKAKAMFSLIFGGSSIGSVTVKNKATGECSGASGEVSTQRKTKLKGFIMALATNAKPKTNASIFRRIPTAKERASAEKLVQAVYTKEKIPAAAMKVLKSHNLTAIDVDHNGTAELVGTYIAVPKKDERVLLFFIAALGKDGTYGFEHSEFERATSENVMSGDVKDLDDGTVRSELLLDYYDVDGDGTSEIFTTAQAFEGRNFYVYRRASGAWKMIFSSYNYRCGY